MAKKNPIAAAAKKMAAAPVSNTVVTEVKAAEVKAETKTEAPKAEEPKKETKKAPAKRAAAKDIKTSVVVQFAGKEVTEKELIAAVKKAYTKKGNKVGDIKTVSAQTTTRSSCNQLSLFNRTHFCARRAGEWERETNVLMRNGYRL